MFRYTSYYYYSGNWVGKKKGLLLIYFITSTKKVKNLSIFKLKTINSIRYYLINNDDLAIIHRQNI